MRVPKGAAGAALAAALVLAGCADAGRPVRHVTASATPTASASPTLTPAQRAGVRTLHDVQTFLGRQRGIQARAEVPGPANAGAASAAAALDSGDFRADLALGPGRGALELIRVGDLTWTRAPARFWVALGYTSASAQRASGKWVVVPVNGFRSLVDALDPVRVLARIRSVPDDAVLGRSVISSGPDRGRLALRLRLDDGPLTLVVAPGRTARLLRVRGGSADKPVDFVVDGYQPVHVDIPAPADVLQP